MKHIQSIWGVMLLTLYAVLAFAGNSIICRLALLHTDIDAVSFTVIRLLSGSLALLLLSFTINRGQVQGGSWRAAFLLFVYAAGFSLAYESIGAGSGALLLFGSVQVTMISYAIWQGEKPNATKAIGLFISFSGLVIHFLPDATTPAIPASLLMLAAGVAWGGYSILGRQSIDPIGVTSGNFWRASTFALLFGLLTLRSAIVDVPGVILAVIAGAATSGLGYIIWYSLLPQIKAIQASVVQLTVPLLTSLAGVVFLNEPITLNFTIVCLLVLFGISLVTFNSSARA